MDTFTLGKGSATKSQFTSERGLILLEVTDHSTILVNSQIKPYPYKNVLGYFLIIPAFWVALKVRGMLLRPPGGQLPARTREPNRLREL